ncbi:NAD(P)/FAD-dependent oxidoreductase [Eilatimonas milleporae]|uniref:3-phenylpropionate/trans-cinnamate dioxygenase ferredoxin reductase subunit n=1 Tax=Eilatimonas milleporae TaxID=911205 RepID=A0A3M0C6V1_9PROT|nr:FAD-dependent oxidoreductase [Eilatimonas milleporae]RMB04635.1 3-phenylpropionate/trans-cinnamate dioxygenase ferredoxin reductase subunit [Eilatimonas milleporae]
MEPIVIVGGGHAAAQLVTSLRQKGLADGSVLISDEDMLPYQRPHLSKAYLAGDLPAERLPIQRQKSYDDAGVRLHLGQKATALDTAARQVTLADGTAVSYGALILATGGRARRMTCPGSDLPGIHYVRTKQDIDSMRDAFTGAQNIAIIGGGYIGLEVAAVASKAGKTVTIIEAENRVLARVVAPEVSAFYTHLHEDAGVTIRTGTMVTGLEGTARAETLVLSDGSRLDTDLVVAGIGLIPNTDLAETAGLSLAHGGIAVDARCRTSDPHIYAVGDVAWFHHPLYGRHMRLESVQNAVDQAKTAVAAIAGDPAVYEALPWFWSDQYDLKLQIAGLSQGYDTIVTRGDPDGRSVAFFYLRDGRLIAADCIARMPEFLAAKKLIAAGIRIPAETLSDENRPFKEIATELLA